MENKYTRVMRIEEFALAGYIHLTSERKSSAFYEYPKFPLLRHTIIGNTLRDIWRMSKPEGILSPFSQNHKHIATPQIVKSSTR